MPRSRQWVVSSGGKGCGRNNSGCLEFKLDIATASQALHTCFPETRLPPVRAQVCLQGGQNSGFLISIFMVCILANCRFDSEVLFGGCEMHRPLSHKEPRVRVLPLTGCDPGPVPSLPHCFTGPWRECVWAGVRIKPNAGCKGPDRSRHTVALSTAVPAALLEILQHSPARDF